MWGKKEQSRWAPEFPLLCLVHREVSRKFTSSSLIHQRLPPPRLPHHDGLQPLRLWTPINPSSLLPARCLHTVTGEGTSGTRFITVLWVVTPNLPASSELPFIKPWIPSSDSPSFKMIKYTQHCGIVWVGGTIRCPGLHVVGNGCLERPLPHFPSLFSQCLACLYARETAASHTFPFPLKKVHCQSFPNEAGIVSNSQSHDDRDFETKVSLNHRARM